MWCSRLVHVHSKWGTRSAELTTSCGAGSISAAADILAAGSEQLDPALYKEGPPCGPPGMQQRAVRYVGGLCLTKAGCGYGEARASASTGPGVVFPTRHMAFVWSTQQKLVGSSLCQNNVRLQVSTLECVCCQLQR
jgi:hypothetical protein